MGFILSWLISALAIAITAYLLPGVRLSGFLAAMGTAAVLGLVNAIIKPLLLILTLPITIITLGLFTLVINAVLIMLTSAIVPGFEVSGFWQALLFSLVLVVVNYLLGLIF
ncbi:phage holin family protein [Geotalea sp. SG265]|uniref:phage holin family protein n=1 Tax=Geotalea sp. SG265 TaxID=2922867 RepID=UPI001FAF0BA1|nr:phage holin family protein [Geotalea sp. SG265]